MGYSKKIYNVLGGFYSNYNITLVQISVHKVNKICKYFLCNYYNLSFSLCLRFSFSAVYLLFTLLLVSIVLAL